MCRAQLSCRRPPSISHGKGVWVDESSRRQRPDPFIPSYAHLEASAKKPDVLPIEAVSAGGNRPFGTHVQTIKDKNPLPNGGLIHATVAHRVIQ